MNNQVQKTGARSRPTPPPAPLVDSSQDVFRLHHRPGAERAGLFDFFRPVPPPRLCKRQGDLQVLCAGRFVPNPATQSFAHVSRDVATDEIGLPHSARPRVFDPISAPETTCHQPIFHQVSTKVMGTKNPALQGFQAGLGFSMAMVGGDGFEPSTLSV